MAEEFLSSEQVDSYVKHYELTKLHNIGNKTFYEKYSNLLKLHEVATIEASRCDNTDCERVKDAFLKYSKVNYLIRDLITLSVWIEKVLPELLKLRPIPNNTLPTYIVLYQETVLLLSIPLNVKPTDASIKLETNAIEDIEKHHRNLSFIVTTQSLSILRFICENLDNLPLSIASRIYTIHDIPILIINLFDNGTWSKYIDGKLFKFNEYSWQQWFPEDAPLSKTEIQILLLIHQLLVKSISTSVYNFDEYRKQQFTKILKYLTENVLDQLNILSDLKRWLLLNCLSGEQGAVVANPLIVDVSSQYREELYNKYEGKWTDIALQCSSLLFYANHIDLLNITKEFSGFLNNVDKLADMTKTCLTCFSKADKRCSKCKKAWYCSRKCQLEHWSAHKHLCQI
ncbi:hypothetical protein O3M35_000147 [Rhynocoris fuscipes]|uniref:MYND-type domain-containing protein n=1 Tax=Rhynocoris fuscipes TaxID=488301 RepID=A0AAW1DLM1_9HEMI